MQLQVSGRFQYLAYQKSDYPVVGDYVLFFETNPHEGIIERIIERNNTLERLATTETYDVQILAANVDIVFICMALNQDFNLTKLQNLISLTFQGDLVYYVLLTKADLCDDVEDKIRDVSMITNATIVVVSMFDLASIEALKNIINQNTCVLIGSSGVGKSTIINTLLEKDYLVTNDIRLTDAQGRHTTTHRELVHLPSGGAIIDTPGIRIIDSTHVEQLMDHFEDVQQYASECRFRDCTHHDEPGCEVQVALAQGDLLEERLWLFRKVQKLDRFHQQQNQIKQRIQDKRQRKRR